MEVSAAEKEYCWTNRLGNAIKLLRKFPKFPSATSRANANDLSQLEKRESSTLPPTTAFGQALYVQRACVSLYARTTVKYSIVVNGDLAGTCFGIHHPWIERKERIRPPSSYISSCHYRLLWSCFVRYS